MQKWKTFEGRMLWLLGEMRYSDPEESGREAGRRLGISGEIVNQWKSADASKPPEKRKRPSFRNLERLHRVTGVNIHWLVTGKGNPHEGAPEGHVQWPAAAGGGVAGRTDRRTATAPTSGRHATAPPKNRS